MKHLCFVLLILTFNSVAQTTKPEVPKPDTLWKHPWTLKAIVGMNGTQTSFVNWSAGGRNNVSALGFIDAGAKYKKRSLKWDTDFKFAVGGLLYLDSTGKKAGLQKTDDRIDLATTFGYEFRKKLFYTVAIGFKTQSLDGFSFPNDSVRISGFMAPAYVSISTGIEYAQNSIFNLYVSPIAGKITIVNDDVLANAGAFGVYPAVYGADGTMSIPGQHYRCEFGAYVRAKFQKELVKNIEMKSRLELFSNYLNNPQNIDVNFENIFAFKVNTWFNASLQWNLIYDDDIDIRSVDGTIGPRTQFKSVLGVGMSYTMHN